MHAREGDSMMNDHTITIEKVASSSNGNPAVQDYQAQCSCGWMSNRSWLAATARRVADYHVSAKVIRPKA
jgi:hypothetical protein